MILHEWQVVPRYTCNDCLTAEQVAPQLKFILFVAGSAGNTKLCTLKFSSDWQVDLYLLLQIQFPLFMFDSSAVLHVMSIMVYKMTCYFTLACQLFFLKQYSCINDLRTISDQRPPAKKTTKLESLEFY